MDEREMVAGTRPGQLERVADASLDAHACVHAALGGDLMGRSLAQHPALAGVGTLGVLADHHELVVGTDERSLVDVEVEGEAQLEEQTALDDPGRHLRCANGAEQDGVELAQLGERGVGENLAVS